MKKLALKRKFNIDKELIIILLLVAIACFIFFFVINQRAFLNVFYLPVLLGAYFFGKRYAIISAFFSVIIICFFAYFFPQSFAVETLSEAQLLWWLESDYLGAFSDLDRVLHGGPL